MAKKKTTTEPKQPAYVEELLTNGTAIITAKTREKLADMLNDIPADCSYAAGAVGFCPDIAAYTLQVNLTN